MSEQSEPAKHSHYFRDVSSLKTVDVYRILELFGVTDPCLQHAIKKLLVAGGRGAGKDITQDVTEAMDTLKRWQQMRAEDAGPRPDFAGMIDLVKQMPDLNLKTGGACAAAWGGLGK